MSAFCRSMVGASFSYSKLSHHIIAASNKLERLRKLSGNHPKIIYWKTSKKRVSCFDTYCNNKMNEESEPFGFLHVIVLPKSNHIIHQPLLIVFKCVVIYRTQDFLKHPLCLSTEPKPLHFSTLPILSSIFPYHGRKTRAGIILFNCTWLLNTQLAQLDNKSVFL